MSEYATHAVLGVFVHAHESGRSDRRRDNQWRACRETGSANGLTRGGEARRPGDDGCIRLSRNSLLLRNESLHARRQTWPRRMVERSCVAMEQLVECIPNFSEGRQADTVRALVAAIRAVPSVFLLD